MRTYGQLITQADVHTLHANQQHRLACYIVKRTELNIWSKVSANTSKAWSLGANRFIC